MKRLIPVVLLSIVLLNFFGVLPVFHLLQQNIRSEVKSRIKAGVAESELHKITISENEKIDWVREGKEFRKDGKMYDVVRQAHHDIGGVTYFCVNDIEEKVLFENLDNLCQQEQNGTPIGKTMNDYFKTFSHIILLQHCILNSADETSFSFPTSDFRLPIFFPSVPTPPPDFS